MKFVKSVRVFHVLHLVSLLRWSWPAGDLYRVGEVYDQCFFGVK